MAGGASQDADEGIVGINVTPLVDITLVLLIIMMVTAKLIVNPSGIPLDLPKASTGTDVQTIFAISLGADGKTQVDSTTVPNDAAILALATDAHNKNADIRAIIKADAAVPHGRVIGVLDSLRKAHVSKIAFGTVTPPPEGTK